MRIRPKCFLISNMHEVECQRWSISHSAIAVFNVAWLKLEAINNNLAKKYVSALLKATPTTSFSQPEQNTKKKRKKTDLIKMRLYYNNFVLQCRSDGEISFFFLHRLKCT